MKEGRKPEYPEKSSDDELQKMPHTKARKFKPHTEARKFKPHTKARKFQANIGTVSRATLGRLLRDGAERVWAFPSAAMLS